MNSLHSLIILVVCIHSICGSRMNCYESEYNDYKDWDCSAIDYYFAPLQVQKTLYCIGYIKTRSPMYPQKTQLNMTRKITKFIDVIDDSREIIFSELLKYYYFEPRLTFKNCSAADLELKSNDLSDYIWIPNISADMYSSFKFHDFGSYKSLSTTLIPSIGVVIREFKYKAVVLCEKMDLQMFPFDEHDCNVSVSAGGYP